MRSDPKYFLLPSAFSIIPNANGSPDDLAVYFARGARIKVYDPRIPDLRVTPEGSYQEWSLTGRNRRLANPNAPYTIYARLRKVTDYTDETAVAEAHADGYLVFAQKVKEGEAWLDPYVLSPNTSSAAPSGTTDPGGAPRTWVPLPSAQTERNRQQYWWVKVGDVSMLNDRLERTVTLDTGILGTDQYNENWELTPDELPTRVELSCLIGGREAGAAPYVRWGSAAVVSARLIEGWGTDVTNRVVRWTIARDTGNAALDAAWNGEAGWQVMASGQKALSHARSGTDDFDGAFAATFTVKAWGVATTAPASEETEGTGSGAEAGGEGGSEGEGETPTPAYTEIGQATITIYAETVERYELVLSHSIMSYSPSSGTYNPAGGVQVRIRATAQDGTSLYLNKAQYAAAELHVTYAPTGTPAAATEVAPPQAAASDAVAVITLTTEAFAAQQNLDIRLLRGAADGEQVELGLMTVAFVRDGEDSQNREWIYYRSTTASYGSAPATIARGEVNPAGAAGDGDTDKNQNGWVPQGWWDHPQGVDTDHPYEFAAYRDYDAGNATWGPFSTPTMWAKYGERGTDGDGVEYVYARSVTEVAPVIGTSDTYGGKTYEDDDYCPPVTGASTKVNGAVVDAARTVDNPQGVSAELPFEWVAKRTKSAPVNGVRTWNAYATGPMTLWAKYSEDGAPGANCPSYIEAQEKWSNDATVTQALTADTGWEDSTPANPSNLAYLWRRSRLREWNDTIQQYDGADGAWTYTRLNGTNGTSINTRGRVEATGYLLDGYARPYVNGATVPVADKVAVADGDAFVCMADGHLYQWSDELRERSLGWTDYRSGWLDLGEFKGDDGVTYFTHIAWAEDVTVGGEGVPQKPEGQTTVPNASRVTGFGIAPAPDKPYMGIMVNTSAETDSTDALLYTWSFLQGAQGENSIQVDLDNEHEDFIYSDNTAVNGGRVSNVVTSRAHLHDGRTEVTAGANWSIATSSGVVTNDSSSPFYASIGNAEATKGLLTVNGINAPTASVTVAAEYPAGSAKYYYAKFTANKTSQDKYELVVSPDSIPYNPATYATATISIAISRMDLQGNVSAAAFGTGATDISSVSGQGKLRLFAVYADSNNASPRAVQVRAASFDVTADIAALNTGVRFELRRYANINDPATATHTVADYETVDIAKVESISYIFLRGTAANHRSDRVVNISNGINQSQYQNSGRGLEVVTINRSSLTLVERVRFDTFGGVDQGTEGDDTANASRTAFVTYLRSLSSDVFVAITSYDAIGWSDAMVSELRNFGLGRLDYTPSDGIPSPANSARTPFAFLGYRGLQQGYALWKKEGTGASDPFAEIMAYVANGMFMTTKEGEQGADGEAAEGWKLIAVERTLSAGVDGSVTAALSYSVLHTVGAQSTMATGAEMRDESVTVSYQLINTDGTQSSATPITVADNETLASLTHPAESSGSDSVPAGSADGDSSDPWSVSDLAGVRMILKKDNLDVDADFVPLTLQAGAAFEVVQAGCDSYIQAHVQGTYATNESVTNLQTTVNQNINSITQRVSGVETQYSTLNGQISGIQSSVTEIEQTTNGIRLEVSKQTAINENYVRNASLASLTWIDREWTRTPQPTSDASFTRHIFRYGGTQTTYDGSSKNVAVLSSYISRALGGVPSLVWAGQQVSVSSGQPYTLSVWARRIAFWANPSIGLYVQGMSFIAAKAYAPSGSDDGSVTVDTSETSSGVVKFKPTAQDDSAWHQMVLVFSVSSSSAKPEFRLWGNSQGFGEWMLTEPCVKAGNGTSDSTARTYGTGNLFRNADLAPALTYYVAQWEVYANANNGAQTYSATGANVPDSSTMGTAIMERLWNTALYKDALLLGGTALATALPQSPATPPHRREGGVIRLLQEYSKGLASELYEKTLVFSVYVKRVKKWGQQGYRLPSEGTLQNPGTISIGLQGSYFESAPTASADDTTVSYSTENFIEDYVTYQMARFSPSDDSWHRVWIVFRLSSEAKTYGFKLGLRVNVGNSASDDWAVAKPKLEIGEVPTAWTDYTGDEIKSVLKDAGIDIDAMSVNIHGEKINLEGTVTANKGFQILTDGSMEARNGTFAGFVRSKPFVVTEENFDTLISQKTDFIRPYEYAGGARDVLAAAKYDPTTATAKWLDLLAMGSSVIFQYNETDKTCIHLPFVAPQPSTGTHGGSDFEHVFSTLYGSDVNNEHYWTEVLRARSFVGCTMEIINNSTASTSVYLCGIGDGTSLDEPGTGHGGPANPSKTPCNPWWYYELPTGCMLLLKCVRKTSGGTNQPFQDWVYWEVVGFTRDVRIPAAALASL